MTKHYSTNASIAALDSGERGVSLRLGGHYGDTIFMFMHNGCGRGNMRAELRPETAIELATDLLSLAREVRQMKP